MAREGFHDVLFPVNLSLGARGGPERRTDIVKLASGGEMRRSRWSRSVRSWDVAVGIQTFEDTDAVVAFFEARQGRRYAFAFRDPFDQASAPIGVPVTPFDQPIGTGDGSRTEFPIRKSYDGVIRPIDLAVPETVRVGVDAVEIDSQEWSLSAERDRIAFSVPPAVGTVITAGFCFDVPVRFAEDSLRLERGARGNTIPSLSLVEVVL